MTTEFDADEQAEALAAAALLERWADEVPKWDPGAGETWHAFATRRYTADRALAARLRRLPGCSLRSDSSFKEIDLTLAGITVHSNACLADACRIWAAEIRQMAAP